MSTRRARRLVVEQIIRPTGLLDPRITLSPLKNQIDDTIELCRATGGKSRTGLVTTLTKRTAEDLSDYLRDVGLKVRYLHSDIDTIERVEILRGAARGGVRHSRRNQSSCGKDSICRKSRSSAFSMRTRKDICAARLRSSRPPAARRGT